ncbi:MAG TPA: phosphatase PAP2 family protein [Bryobacteraceae bacterium]
MFASCPKLPTLLIAGGLAAGVGILVFLGIEISVGKTQAFDRAILLAMRRPDDHAPVGSAAFQQTARDISALGSATVLWLLTGTIAGFLTLDGKKRLALFICGCIATGLLLETILKDIFDRPRPDIVPEATYTRGASFPSGHAMMSAIVYLSLGASLARFHRRKAVKAYSIIVAVFLTILIGVTRVYLGVHWPTDVLAGWAVGGVWALLCQLAANMVLLDRV